ncbi:MAG: SDR family NAD(P)-dependent oxidoreductase [Alphaproteobacteria bacterium]|nr:SDR family NAD(P)-dependent oxidoreductase [Alphaproteobacteria bacterium]
MTQLAHRRALVTGGTSGIGLAIARQLRAAGLEVVVCGRDPDRLQQALDAVPGLRGFTADLGHADQRRRLIQDTVDELGGLDLLVANAAVQHAVDWTRPAQDFGRQLAREIEVDLVAPLHLAGLAVPALSAAPGPASIVFVTSVLAVAPKAVAPAYCASKAGLRSACGSLRAQLSPLGIDVVELIPPVVDTAMTEGRDQAKVPPQLVADALVAGLQGRRPRIAVGAAKQALWLHRLAPGLLEGMLIGKA